MTWHLAINKYRGNALSSCVCCYCLYRKGDFIPTLTQDNIPQWNQSDVDRRGIMLRVNNLFNDVWAIDEFGKEKTVRTV